MGRLDIATLERILDALLPSANKSAPEPYAELLGDLASVGIDDAGRLERVLHDKLGAILEAEGSSVERVRAEVLAGKPRSDDDVARVRRGVYFTHAGLLRLALRKRFGSAFQTEDELRH